MFKYLLFFFWLYPYFWPRFFTGLTHGDTAFYGYWSGNVLLVFEFPVCHRIGWWKNLQETPIFDDFDGKNPWVSCRFSPKPIHWVCWTKQQNPLEELRDLLGRAADGIALRKQLEVSFGKGNRGGMLGWLVVGGDWNHGWWNMTFHILGMSWYFSEG